MELDLSYIGEAPPEDEDVATTRELQDGNGGIGYSTWVSTKPFNETFQLNLSICITIPMLCLLIFL